MLPLLTSCAKRVESPPGTKQTRQCSTAEAALRARSAEGLLVSLKSPTPVRAIGRAFACRPDAQRDRLCSPVAFDRELDALAHRGKADLVAELGRAANWRTIGGDDQIALPNAGLLGRRFRNHFGDQRANF